MGHNLTRMLRASAVFPTATYGEQAVALVIADICMDVTRRPPANMNASARVCEDLDMPPGTLGNMLAKLAGRGLELRVPISMKNGRPLFAAKGHSVDFLFPELPPRDSRAPRIDGPLSAIAPRIDGPLESEGPLRGGALSAKGPRDEAQRSTPAWTPTPVTTGIDDTRSLSPRARVARRIRQAEPEATEREIDLLIARVEAERSPDHVDRYIASYPDTTIAETIRAIRTGETANEAVPAAGRAADAGSAPTPTAPPVTSLCGRCGAPGHVPADCPTLKPPAPLPPASPDPPAAVVEPCDAGQRCRRPAAPITEDGYHELCRTLASVRAGRPAGAPAPPSADRHAAEQVAGPARAPGATRPRAGALPDAFADAPPAVKAFLRQFSGTPESPDGGRAA